MERTESRPMGLLWETQPETVDRLHRSFGAGIAIIFELYDIYDEHQQKIFDLCVEFAEKCLIQFSKDYFEYKDDDAALDAYIEAMEWLTENKVSERFDVFESLTLHVIHYEFGDEIKEYDKYDPEDFYILHGLIEFFGSWAGLKQSEIDNMASGIFVQIKEEKRNENTQTRKRTEEGSF